jgi:hypothetical protein
MIDLIHHGGTYINPAQVCFVSHVSERLRDAYEYTVFFPDAPPLTFVFETVEEAQNDRCELVKKLKGTST